MRRVGRIAIGLLAGTVVITALASLTGVPARFSHHLGTKSPDHGVSVFLNPASPPEQSAPPEQSVAPVHQRPCERQTLIGSVSSPSVTARTLPSFAAPAIATFPRTNAEGAPQVFDVQARVQDRTGELWYRALLPLRPNGTSGYVPADSLRLAGTGYRLEVNREKLRLTVWDGCVALMKFPIGLGKESTPTPNGRYYVIALLKPPIAGSVYGTYAYGLSAFSDVLTDWAGGGIIGLHGTNDPSSIGDRLSHGCIRMNNADIEKLVPILPLGTPVDIE